MTRRKRGTKYETLKLHDKLVEMIDEQVSNRGFTSRSDYLKFLVRKDVEGREKIEKMTIIKRLIDLDYSIKNLKPKKK